jgi:ribosomal protein L7/L12
MTSFDAGKKLNIIKAFKDHLGLPLKDAKELLEKGEKILKKDVPKEQAEELVKHL